MKRLEHRRICGPVLEAMDSDRIKAFHFGEVGAMWDGSYVILISDFEDRVVMTQGSYGFSVDGHRHEGNVDFGDIEEKLPFLKRFMGVSRETTVRGSGPLPDEDWVHLSEGFGNHFFLRAELFEEYNRRLLELGPVRFGDVALAVALEMFGADPGPRAREKLDELRRAAKG